MKQKSITLDIKGIPYRRNKSGWNKPGPLPWISAIKKQTQGLHLDTRACLLRATFMLPPGQRPSRLAVWPNLDNLLKPLLNALKKTLFCKAKGQNPCVIYLNATKVMVNSDEEAGTRIELLPIPKGLMSEHHLTV